MRNIRVFCICCRIFFPALSISSRLNTKCDDRVAATKRNMLMWLTSLVLKMHTIKSNNKKQVISLLRILWKSSYALSSAKFVFVFVLLQRLNIVDISRKILHFFCWVNRFTDNSHCSIYHMPSASKQMCETVDLMEKENGYRDVFSSFASYLLWF